MSVSGCALDVLEPLWLIHCRLTARAPVLAAICDNTDKIDLMVH